VRVRHRPIETDAVVWDGSAAALQELFDLGLDVNGYRFEPTVGDPTVTLVISSAEGDRHVLPGWAAVKGVTINGVFTGWMNVPPDVYGYVYIPLGESGEGA
jgi:hypothetical protein